LIDEIWRRFVLDGEYMIKLFVELDESNITRQFRIAVDPGLSCDHLGTRTELDTWVLERTYTRVAYPSAHLDGFAEVICVVERAIACGHNKIRPDEPACSLSPAWIFVNLPFKPNLKFDNSYVCLSVTAS
jgi:hypothetical protein